MPPLRGAAGLPAGRVCQQRRPRPNERLLDRGGHIADPSLHKTYGFTIETGPAAATVEESFHPADPTLIKRDAKSGLIALIQQTICAIELIGTQLGGATRAIQAVRLIRDDLRDGSDAGRVWVELLERMQAPAAAALLRDPELAHQAGALLRRVGVLAQKSRSGVITDTDVDLAVDVLRRARGTDGTESVRSELNLLEQHVTQLRGTTLGQAIEALHGDPPTSRKPKARRTGTGTRRPPASAAPES